MKNEYILPIGLLCLVEIIALKVLGIVGIGMIISVLLLIIVLELERKSD